MCLHEITNREPEDCGIGYKVFFRCRDGELMSPLIAGSIYRQPYEWVADHKTEEIRDFERHVSYQTGFHILKNKEDAVAFRVRLSRSPSYVVAKVSYRKAVVEGTNLIGFENSQCILKPCVVAREMKILEILPEEEPCASMK